MNKDFELGLRRFRRSLLAETLKTSVPGLLDRGLTVAVLFALVFAILKVSGLIPDGIYIWLVPLCAGFVCVAVPLWRRLVLCPGCLEKIAQQADVAADSRNQIATALELSRCPCRGEWAEYTIQRGMNILVKLLERKDKVSRQDVYARTVFCKTLAFILFVFFPAYPELGIFPERGIEDILAVNAQPSTDKSNEQNSRERKLSAYTPVEKTNSMQVGMEHQFAAFRHNQAFDGNNPNMTAGRFADTSAQSRKPDKRSPDKHSRKKDSRQSFAPSTGKERGGSSASGNVDLDSSQELAMASEHYDAGMETDQSARNRQRQNRISANRGGSKPLTPDRAAPPDRRMGEGKKDAGDSKPQNGRGGESGHKKSRGTTSMLPGMVIPDMIAGKLNPGAEIRRPEFMSVAETAAGYDPTLADKTPAAPEPELKIEDCSHDLKMARQRFLLGLNKFYVKEQL
jgi:hypothetical protein